MMFICLLLTKITNFVVLFFYMYMYMYTVVNKRLLFVFSASSARNKEAFAIVSDAISNDYGGVERCPWSPAQLRGECSLFLLKACCTLYPEC